MFNELIEYFLLKMSILKTAAFFLDEQQMMPPVDVFYKNKADDSRTSKHTRLMIKSLECILLVCFLTFIRQRQGIY